MKFEPKKNEGTSSIKYSGRAIYCKTCMFYTLLKAIKYSILKGLEFPCREQSIEPEKQDFSHTIAWPGWEEIMTWVHEGGSVLNRGSGHGQFKRAMGNCL